MDIKQGTLDSQGEHQDSQGENQDSQGEERPREASGLSPEQRKLVEKHLGLVGVHLRRVFPAVGAGQPHRERDDLFQEGCLGLIRAVQRYRQDSGIPFAAYALPRIHNAVSRALERHFSTIYVPRQRTRGPKGDRGGDDAGEPRRGREPRCDSEPRCSPKWKDRQRESSRIRPESSRGGRAKPVGSQEQRAGRERQGGGRVSRMSVGPKVFSISEELASLVPDRHAISDEPQSPHAESIGDRMRVTYERALRAASDEVIKGRSRRGDRVELVRCIVDERLLIPDEEQRSPLRRLARDTRSSYARVAQCEKLLRETVRDKLNRDPEYRELQRCRRESERGMGRSIDEVVERRLASATVDDFLDRFARAAGDDRARMLMGLLTVMGDEATEGIRLWLANLTSVQRRQLVLESPSTRKQGTS